MNKTSLCEWVKARQVACSSPYARVGEGSAEGLIVVSDCVLADLKEAARALSCR